MSKTKDPLVTMLFTFIRDNGSEGLEKVLSEIERDIVRFEPGTYECELPGQEIYTKATRMAVRLRAVTYKIKPKFSPSSPRRELWCSSCGKTLVVRGIK